MIHFLIFWKTSGFILNAINLSQKHQGLLLEKIHLNIFLVRKTESTVLIDIKIVPGLSIYYFVSV